MVGGSCVRKIELKIMNAKIREKMSISHMGNKLSEKTKEKISNSHKGKIIRPETRVKLSEALKGKEKSEEHRLNISRGRKGKGFVKSGDKSPNWKGGKILINCSQCGREILRPKWDILRHKDVFCNIKCRGKWLSENKVGMNHPCWKPDEECTATKEKMIRKLNEYNIWRITVFERDNYSCQICHKNGGTLNAHHRKSFITIVKENNINNKIDAISCKELWDINNGVTLCENCHNTIHEKAN